MVIKAWWEGGLGLILAKPGRGAPANRVASGWQWGQGPLLGPLDPVHLWGGELLTDEGGECCY